MDTHPVAEKYNTQIKCHISLKLYITPSPLTGQGATHSLSRLLTYGSGSLELKYLRVCHYKLLGGQKFKKSSELSVNKALVMTNTNQEVITGAFYILDSKFNVVYDRY